MDKNEVNLLTLKPYYRINSTITGRLYIDKDLRCYLFEAEREAKQFCDHMENVEYAPAKLEKQGPFLSECYGLGVSRIRIKPIKKDKYQEIEVKKADARRQFYNHDTMASLLRLKQTKKKKHLRELANALLLTPVVIDKRESGEYPTIHYSYATIGEDGRKYFVLFTTLYDFNIWNEANGGGYEPNQTSLQDFNRIRKNNRVLINPMTDKLILTNKQISEITIPEEEEEH